MAGLRSHSSGASRPCRTRGQKVKWLWVQHRGQTSPQPVSRQAGTMAPARPPHCPCCSTLPAHSHRLSFLLLLCRPSFPFLGGWLSRVCVCVCVCVCTRACPSALPPALWGHQAKVEAPKSEDVTESDSSMEHGQVTSPL